MKYVKYDRKSVSRRRIGGFIQVELRTAASTENIKLKQLPFLQGIILDIVCRFPG